MAWHKPAKWGNGRLDEKVLEEIRFHQDTLGRDANSPLHLIREKEMEIAGRVLAARKHAEEIVAKARKKAVEVTMRAEGEGLRLAEEHEKAVSAEAEREIEKINASTESEIEELRRMIAERSEEAAEFVVKVVTRV